MRGENCVSGKGPGACRPGMEFGFQSHVAGEPQKVLGEGVTWSHLHFKTNHSWNAESHAPVSANLEEAGVHSTTEKRKQCGEGRAAHLGVERRFSVLFQIIWNS